MVAFKVLRQSFFEVMGKVLSGELSCMGTGLCFFCRLYRCIIGLMRQIHI